MRKGRTPPKWPLCAYCGLRPGTTRDHVIPKGLFPKPRPQSIITVPVCALCNNAKSQDDDYLRDMLVIDFQTEGHPIAQQILKGPMIRSAARNKSRVARAAQLASGRIPIRTPSGLYIGNAVVIPLESDRLQRIFATIVRGLTFHFHQRRLPPDCVFEASRVVPTDTAEILKTFQEWASPHRRVL